MADFSKKRGVAPPPARPYAVEGKKARPPAGTGRGGKRAAGIEAAQQALEAWLSADVDPRLALVGQIRDGFPFELVEGLAAQSGIAVEELLELGVIPRRTWTHSKQHQRFTPTQSARVARFFRVLQKANDTFGSDDKAMLWLKRPTRPLHNNAPVELLDTEEGARLVEDLLTRINHGIAA